MNELQVEYENIEETYKKYAEKKLTDLQTHLLEALIEA